MIGTDFAVTATIITLAVMLFILTYLYKNARNSINQLNQALSMLRQAKAMDEREIVQLKAKIDEFEERHFKLLREHQALETEVNNLKQKNNKPRGG